MTIAGSTPGSSPGQAPGEGQGSEAQLHGPCADGEPQRAGGGWPGEPGDGAGGMPGRRGHAEGRREEPDRAVTVGADKAYDTTEFVKTCKAFGAEAHAARNTAGRRSNTVGTETRGFKIHSTPNT